MTIKVTLEMLPVRLEFEVGSIGEARAVLNEDDTNLREFHADCVAGRYGGTDTAIPEGADTAAAPAKVPGKRGPKGKNTPDPTTASAPAPIPAPGAPPSLPAPPTDMTPDPVTGIPAGLVRTAPPAPAPVAAPPAPPAPPPAPPVAAPNITLGPKVAEYIKNATKGDAAAEAQWIGWVAGQGMIAAGATFGETIDVLSFITDDDAKMVAAASALQIK